MNQTILNSYLEYIFSVLDSCITQNQATYAFLWGKSRIKKLLSNNPPRLNKVLEDFVITYDNLLSYIEGKNNGN